MTGETSEKNFLNVREFAQAVNEDFRKVYQDIKKDNYCIKRFIEYDNNNKIKIHKSAVEYFLSHDKFDKVRQNKDENIGSVENSMSDKSRQGGDNFGQETSSKIIIDLLNDRIKAQEKELNIKNQQIETLQNQLSNSQKLLAMEKQEKQALLEGGNEQNIGVVGHIKRLMFGKKSDKIEE